MSEPMSRRETVMAPSEIWPALSVLIVTEASVGLRRRRSGPLRNKFADEIQQMYKA
mgnify:CR=1 FL=1